MTSSRASGLLNARQAADLTGIRAALLLKFALLGRLRHLKDARTGLILFALSDLEELKHEPQA
jgi:hypothetical protein